MSGVMMASARKDSVATGRAFFPFLDVGFIEPVLVGMWRRDYLGSERRSAADPRSLTELGRRQFRLRGGGLWDGGRGADRA
jgi:hypothetical protein